VATESGGAHCLLLWSRRGSPGRSHQPAPPAALAKQQESRASRNARGAGEAAILFFIPDVLSRLVAFGAEIAFLLIFPAFMEKEFSEWQATNPSAVPSNGWNAVGWGLVGAVVFLLIVFVVFVVLAVLVPAGK
jgi:hypothetical protein